MNNLTQKALELCWEIEKLPASEQQTKVIMMASNLYNLLEADEGGKLLDSIEPSEKAKEIGVRVSDRLAEHLLTPRAADLLQLRRKAGAKSKAVKAVKSRRR